MTNNRDERRYRKWESDHEKRGTSELIPAATVVIMRDSESAIELLMLRKNSKVAFGGMWVFPGGKIENKESKEKAAIREVMEETGLSIDPYYLGQVSHQYSHFKVCISLFLANIEDDSCLETKQKYQWVTRKRINDFPLPKANYKMLEILDKLE